MNTPHIHAELIKQWADNPELPVYLFNILRESWVQIFSSTIHWDPTITYHVGSHPPELKVIRRQDRVAIPQPVQMFDLNKDLVLYVPDLSTKGYREIKPTSQLDPIFIQKGLIFYTPEAAVKALEVMLEGFSE